MRKWKPHLFREAYLLLCKYGFEGYQHWNNKLKRKGKFNFKPWMLVLDVTTTPFSVRLPVSFWFFSPFILRLQRHKIHQCAPDRAVSSIVLCRCVCNRILTSFEVVPRKVESTPPLPPPPPHHQPSSQNNTWKMSLKWYKRVNFVKVILLPSPYKKLSSQHFI